MPSIEEGEPYMYVGRDQILGKAICIYWPNFQILSDYEEYSWCEDWMNGNNGDFDPNYIAVWKTTKEGWYFSRSYDCYLKAVDLSDSVDSENYKACAIEEDEKHKYPNPPNS